jgi:hypothetical protein
MTRTIHGIYHILLILFVIAAVITLIINGMSYYNTSMEERVYHPDHSLLKPSGIIGHGLGIFGSLFMILGVALYMARKRYRIMSRMGILKHWLEFHIFLCTLGPFLVLFHTAYKFGGLVVISFWSMVAVFFSGIIGRFIYLQIPHSIEGRALTLSEIREMQSNITGIIKDSEKFDNESFEALADILKKKPEIYYKNPFVRYYNGYVNDKNAIHTVKTILKKNHLPSSESKEILALARNDIKINRRIERLEVMQNLFKYWHVIHLPFAMVMLIIMIIHIVVTYVFGYRWIF